MRYAFGSDMGDDFENVASSFFLSICRLEIAVKVCSSFFFLLSFSVERVCLFRVYGSACLYAFCKKKKKRNKIANGGQLVSSRSRR